MALHTGTADWQAGDYHIEYTLNRLARLLAAGHGGQILLSGITWDLVRSDLPAGITARTLGALRLKDLVEPLPIFQLVVPDIPSDFPPLRTLDLRPNNLPTQLTALIGREQEIQSATALLRRPSVRLVTFVGPGGTGKTRLALQVAAEVSADFGDGVFFVNLAPITNPELIATTIAGILGLREVAGQILWETLQHYLRTRRVLLVLDNFEQVLGATPLVADLLRAAANLKVLVTSRSVLHVSGEHEFSVPPLALPNRLHPPPMDVLTQYDAVWLFIERARAVRADFTVTNDNAPAVAEICHRLDGLPLAIELAAARIRILSPQALLQRLASRLTLLTRGARELPARQQTLRNTIDWSYSLLAVDEQALFRRLAVFVGGRALEAIEAVCHIAGDRELDALNGVASLVDKSLLQQEEGSEGETRFWMLETIWEYALEQLTASGELVTLRRQHAQYYVELTEQAVRHLEDSDQGISVQRLEREYDNLRAVLSWSSESGGDVAVGMRLVSLLWHFWEMHSHFAEGRAWAGRMLAASGNEPASQRADVLTAAGTMAWSQGDFAQAAAFHEQAVQLYRDLDDQPGIAFALNNLALQVREQGSQDRATALCHESLALYRALGDRRGTAMLLHNLGDLAHEQGDHNRAEQLFEESLALERAIGDTWLVARTIGSLGSVVLAQDRYAAATTALTEALVTSQQLGDKLGVAQMLTGFAQLASRQNQPTRAVRLFAAADTLLQTVCARFVGGDKAELNRDSDVTRVQLDPATWAAARASGQAMLLAEAVAFALEVPTAAESAGEPVQERLPTPVLPASIARRDPDALTAREVEVLRRAAKGLTDAEIGTQLVLSPRTVQVHLRSIYSKLGITTRSAATRYALEHHLA
jgi:predicted ATPase/DNA-binding CsgD family transcriptional regulator